LIETPDNLEPRVITRMELMRWLWPHCNHEHAAMMYRYSNGEMKPGWIGNAEDVKRACAAFLGGTLSNEQFDTQNKTGVLYTIQQADGLGLVLHHDGMVSACCIDLDDHTGDGGNVHLLGSLTRFFGATPVVFTSKGGNGLHCFYQLKDPIPTNDFMAWCKWWGFNREKQPEIFPKTEKLTQVWMPGEPNELGGDIYVSGEFEHAVLEILPKASHASLTNATLRFLRGEVTQPGRNAALNIAAMELAQKGVDRKEAFALCQRAALLCGLEQGETDSTFVSGYNAGIESPLVTSAQSSPEQAHKVIYELDGIGNAERFVSIHAQDARYCETLDSWFVWSTTRWLESKTGVQAMAKETARLITDPSHRKRSSSKQGVREILYLAGSEPGMSVELKAFDGNPMIFNCRSGTIDLRTGKINSHDRADLLRKVSPVSYSPSGKCPSWLAFLDTVFNHDHELIGYIQRVCGYMLTGDVSEHCLFFLYGDGCNGKSVFASLLQFILGDYAIRSPTGLVMKTLRNSSGGATPDVARLLGARLAVTSELEEGHTLSESRVKDLTGGDRMVARPLYSEPFEFDPTHKLLLYGNHKPEIIGTDQGIWRRMRLIPFEVSIPDSSRDPHLLDKLKSESNEILAWMVNGCLDWQRDGLGLPDAVRIATGGFRAESDAVGRFIEECCVLADGVVTLKSVIYNAYTEWCKRSGELVLTSKALHPRIVKHGLVDKRVNTGRCWVGIELRKDQ